MQPKAGDPTGTVLTASASVVFDNNSPVVTTPITNTIDAVAPTSTVLALPADVLANFPVSWSGTDDAHGSGIASYNVFASEDGGPFVLWEAGTTDTSDTYNGEAGHTYAFYSVATDNAGNIQALPAAAQATTTAVAPATLAFSTSLYQVNENAGFASVAVTRSGNTSTAATVEFATGGGTAVAGVQYTPVSMSLSFAPGVMSQVVEIPIRDNLVHGGDLFVDMALSEPSALGTLGPVSSAVLDIHQNDPALVTVLNVSLQKETLKKHKKVTVIVLQFSGALDASDAQNRLLYSLAPETTKKHVIKLGKPVAPATAIYNARTNTVTLTPKKAARPESGGAAHDHFVGFARFSRACAGWQRRWATRRQLRRDPEQAGDHHRAGWRRAVVTSGGGGRRPSSGEGSPAVPTESPSLREYRVYVRPPAKTPEFLRT